MRMRLAERALLDREQPAEQRGRRAPVGSPLVQAREIAQRNGEVGMQLAELRLPDRAAARARRYSRSACSKLSARIVGRRQIVERLHQLDGLGSERLLAYGERATKIALRLLEIAEGERDLS